MLLHVIIMLSSVTVCNKWFNEQKLLNYSYFDYFVTIMKLYFGCKIAFQSTIWFQKSILNVILRQSKSLQVFYFMFLLIFLICYSFCRGLYSDILFTYLQSCPSSPPVSLSSEKGRSFRFFLFLTPVLIFMYNKALFQQ